MQVLVKCTDRSIIGFPPKYVILHYNIHLNLLWLQLSNHFNLSTFTVGLCKFWPGVVVMLCSAFLYRCVKQQLSEHEQYNLNRA